MSTTLAEPPVVKAPVPPISWNREQLKDEVKEAISRLGGVVCGGGMRELRDLLGFDKDTTPVRRIQSSLWHLTEEGVLEYSGRKPEGLCPTSEDRPRHCYRLVCP